MTVLKNIKQELSSFRLRLLAAAAFVLFCLALLFLRLIYLQIWQHDSLFERGESNRVSIVPIVPNRGLIKDRNGVVLASNYSAYTLEVTPSKVAELEERLAGLTAKFDQATDEKNRAIAQAESTQQRADLAQRLVRGLADEKVRWSSSIQAFQAQFKNLVGDLLLGAAFVSYIGAFSSPFRVVLVTDHWMPDLISRKLPMTPDITALQVLANDASIAGWNNEGLPTDMTSTQNGAVMVSAKRWALMIDPQLQGINWVRSREAKAGIKFVQQSQPRYLDQIEVAIGNGDPIMIENLPEEIDAVLDSGTRRARTIAAGVLARAREAVGFSRAPRVVVA